MPHSFPNNGNAAEFVGQTPWSARDALVPRPEQRYQHPAKREQADGGVGRSPGGLPHIIAAARAGSNTDTPESRSTKFPSRSPNSPDCSTPCWPQSPGNSTQTDPSYKDAQARDRFLGPPPRPD